MGNLEVERTTTAWAARDASGILSPYTCTLRNTGPEDVYIKVLFCGVCHTDTHLAKNQLGMSHYPLVPGHEVVGKVVEAGPDVTKFRVGDVVGVGLVVGCCRNCNPCNTDNEQYCNKKIWTFAVKIPEGMVPEQAAPLLCAGVTVYSPLRHLGLNVGGIKRRNAGDWQVELQLCKGRRLTTMIQVVKMDYISTAFERLEKNNVRYRFVVDVAGSR
ncbi:hypothetical protein EV1_003183 [Malus domestica]